MTQNLELLARRDTFLESEGGVCVPHEHVATYDSGHSAFCAQFNAFGSLLAIGYTDGFITIYDVTTKQAAKNFSYAHTKCVLSLDWSCNGHYLLSGGFDHKVKLWRVESGKVVFKLFAEVPVIKVEYHPTKRKCFLVSMMQGPVSLYNLDTRTKLYLPTKLAQKNGFRVIQPTRSICEECDDFFLTAAFHHNGRHILSSTSTGHVNVLDIQSLTIVSCISIGTNTGIRDIVMPKKKQQPNMVDCIINCSDRSLRLFVSSEFISGKCDDIQELEPVKKLQDNVNKIKYKGLCFSADGEHFGVLSGGVNPQVFIYTMTGYQQKVIPLKKNQAAVDLAWHPHRPIISVVSGGILYLWGPVEYESWSSYAPGFKEVTENAVYEEEEGEFDVDDEDAAVPGEVSTGGGGTGGGADREGGEEEIDIMSYEIYGADERSGEPTADDEPPLLYIKVEPEFVEGGGDAADSEDEEEGEEQNENKPATTAGTSARTKGVATGKVRNKSSKGSKSKKPSHRKR